MLSKSFGTNASEAELAFLCQKTFLSLWSWPNVFKRDRKELCDVIAVFGNDIFIFSDKSIAYPTGDDRIVNWKRWYKRAVQSSGKQLLGAHRYLLSGGQVFIDTKAQIPLPVPLPDVQKANVHLIAIATGAEEACQKELDDYPSFTLSNAPPEEIESDFDRKAPEGLPDVRMFHAGDINPRGQFVHIFNGAAFHLLTQAIDTINDFSDYLQRRALFFRQFNKRVWVRGEEDLIHRYFMFQRQKEPVMINSENFEKIQNGNYDFVSLDGISFDELCRVPQLIARQELNQKSYTIDALIEKFAKNIFSEKSMSGDGTFKGFEYHASAVKYLATMTRFQRRMLAERIYGAARSYKPGVPYTSYLFPRNPTDGHFVFVLLQAPPEDYEAKSYEEFMEMRNAHLLLQCARAKLASNASIVIGLATEPLKELATNQNAISSESIIVIDGELDDTLKEQAEAVGEIKMTEVINIRHNEFASSGSN